MEVGAICGANSQPLLAMECYRKALAFEPGNADAMAGIGRVLRGCVLPSVKSQHPSPFLTPFYFPFALYVA